MSETATEQLRARRKSNLAFTFLSLDQERRDAMAVFYDFCREVDDIADEPGPDAAEKSALLGAWRERINACFDHRPVDERGQPLADVVRRYEVDQQPLLDIIDGVAMDIDHQPFADFPALQRYCYGVASAVGLVSIRIFGCTQPTTKDFAENLGYALQFTNILRDVVEDYTDNHRIYLPRREMEAFGVEPEHLADPDRHPACAKLFRLQYFRAKHFFRRARRLLSEADRDKLRAALVMGAFYEDILDTIATRGFRLGRTRLKLSKGRKLRLLSRTLRELKRPLAPQCPPRTIAVLGAGIAGMTAAIELASQGHTVNLYEARTFIGGRAHSLRDAGSGLTLDNGQHVMMGCYHHLLNLIDKLGIADKLDLPDHLDVAYRDGEGNPSALRAWGQAGPLHLLGALLGFKALTWADRMAIMRLGLRLKTSRRLTPKADRDAAGWLREEKQTDNALRTLWRPFCVAALNAEPEQASAALLEETLRRALFGSARDAAVITSRVGLSELFEPELQHYLNAVGGHLQLGHQVTALEVGPDDRITGALTAKDGRIEADYFISALPWSAFRRLLPDQHPLHEALSGLGRAGILNIHLVTNRPLFAETFIGLLDSPLHWVFDRSHHLPTGQSGQYLYAITMSAADAWMNQSSETILTMVRGELEKHFPDARDFETTRSLVIKTKDATFAAHPGVETLRATFQSPWPNLFLAGDWTPTGLPATLEGAAQSGFAAAAAVEQGA